eukprot:2485030-Karenia_brevis.AAC.1
MEGCHVDSPAVPGACAPTQMSTESVVNIPAPGETAAVDRGMPLRRDDVWESGSHATPCVQQ